MVWWGSTQILKAKSTVELPCNTEAGFPLYTSVLKWFYLPKVMNKHIFNYHGCKLVYMGVLFAKFFFFKMSIPSLIILFPLFSILADYFSIHWVSGGKNTGVQSVQTSFSDLYPFSLWLTACGLNKGWVLLTSQWCIRKRSSEAERVTDLWPLIVAMSDSPILICHLRKTWVSLQIRDSRSLEASLAHLPSHTCCRLTC